MIHLPPGVSRDLAAEQWRQDAATNAYKPPQRPGMTPAQDAWCRKNIKGYAELQDAMKARVGTRKHW